MKIIQMQAKDRAHIKSSFKDEKSNYNLKKQEIFQILQVNKLYSITFQIKISNGKLIWIVV